jgi:hypothetical protein
MDDASRQSMMLAILIISTNPVFIKKVESKDDQEDGETINAPQLFRANHRS